MTSRLRTERIFRGETGTVSSDVWPVISTRGVGRFQIQGGGSITTFTLLCEVRIDPDAPWETLLTITEADANASGQYRNDGLVLWPQHRFTITALTGTSPTIDAWFSF